MLDSSNIARRFAISQNTGGFDLNEVINFVWRRWKFILGVTSLTLLIATIFIARQTPLYSATAQLLLDTRKEKAAGPDAIFSEAGFDPFWLESQMTIIKSTAMLRRVVEKERLVVDPEFGRPGPQSSGNIGGILAHVKTLVFRSASPNAEQKAAAQTATSIVGGPAEINSTVQAVKGALSVTRSQGDGQVLTIVFTSADPAKAARLANAVADAYIVDKLDARFEAAKRASAWLSDRVTELRQQLRASEEAVARFREENNLTGAAPGTTLNQEQLGQLNARLVAARSEAAEKKARLDILQKLQARGDGVASLPDIANSGALGDLRRQLSDLSRQEADLLARYGSGHPTVVNLRAQIADVKRTIGAETQRVAGTIRGDYELAKARLEAVERTVREVTGQTGLDATKAITLRELERNVAVNKSLFEDFLQRAKITQEQSTFEARDARVITPALPPTSPAYPRTSLILFGAAALGLVFGGAGAFVLELLNAGFTTPRQVEEILELPLLASISKMDARELSVDGETLTVPEYPLAKPLSRLSEAFRSLRSAIQMSDVDNPPKVLLFTSTIPSEGKSTLALGLAASAAQPGTRVLIIDADLRRPSLSHMVAAEKKAGLVEYLAGEAELASTIIYDRRFKTWCLPAGGKTHNPPDLLASERMKALIAALRSEFELIVIDSPPIGPVIDPLLLSQIADKVVYVVRWASTARELVAHSIQRLGGHKKVAGVVFNQVVDSQAQKYGHAYSYYGGRYYKQYYME